MLPGSVPTIAVHHTFIEVSQSRAAGRYPTQETADQVEAPPSTVASEAEFNETRGVALDELSVGSVLEAPEQPAPAQVLFRNHHLSSAVESGSSEQTMPIRSNA
jgi:hypothetical protein